MEKTTSSPHLKHQPMNIILNECLPKLLNILDCLLDKLSIEIEVANPYEKYSNTVENIKRLKTETVKSETDEGSKESPESSSNSENGSNKHFIQSSSDDNKELIHSIVYLLNCIEAGLKSHTMGMIEILKMAQLTVKYFFWCLTEMSKFTILFLKLKYKINFIFYRSYKT